MSSSNFYSHLTLNERIIIETGCFNGSTKKAIAETIGKDPSTVGKEIKAHRFIAKKFSLPLECANYQKCVYARNCKIDCPDFKQFKCKRRDKSPGVCNGCEKYNHCRFSKYKYIAKFANNEYSSMLVETRVGFNTTCDKIKEIGTIIEPLLAKGQSLEQILLSHPEIGVSLKTLYTYVESSVFKDLGFDISAISLRRQVSRRIPKKIANVYKKREDRKYLNGRKYSDYKNYISDNPSAKIVQMDTVYNDVSNGPFIQTFLFVSYHFLFCIYHEEKTAQSMNDGVLLLEDILGPKLFQEEVEVLLTDRGSEFYRMYEIESRLDSSTRTRVFYCDPIASCQKGKLENKHEELRYILPKEHNLNELGLCNQEKMNLATSHINSSKRKKLSGKSPTELMNFLNPMLFEKFKNFGITEIESDEVTLRPSLLK